MASMSGPSTYPVSTYFQQLHTHTQTSGSHPSQPGDLGSHYLEVADFKMEASKSNLPKTQVEPQELLCWLLDFFGLLQVMTLA